MSRTSTWRMRVRLNPLTVDPLIQQAELQAADGATYDYFGYPWRWMRAIGTGEVAGKSHRGFDFIYLPWLRSRFFHCRQRP